jgi:hypothetical protein
MTVEGTGRDAVGSAKFENVKMAETTQSVKGCG